MTRLEALNALKEAVEAGEPNKNDGTAYMLFGDAWVHVYDIYSNGSLDAARALHEAVLPGRTIKIKKGVKDWIVHIPRLDQPNKVDWGRSPGLPQAWLLAILSALIAQEAAE